MDQHPPMIGPREPGQRCALCRHWSNAPAYRCGHGVYRAAIPVWGQDGGQCPDFERWP